MNHNLETIPFDPAEYLEADGIRDLLEDALASGDDGFIRHALNTIARSRGLSQVARDAGVTRAALYKALGEDGDPKLSTLMKLLNALGIRLSLAAGIAPVADETPVLTL